jgi:serine-type anaerobic sulfatase-maturating enzyme
MLDLIVLPKQVKFGQDKRGTLTRYCRDCDIRFACHSGRKWKHCHGTTPTSG